MPVVETIVALLDPVGGHVLVNLATAGALAATVVGIARLVQAWGHDNGDLVALAFLASPIVIAALVADFVWATAFWQVWGRAGAGARPLAGGRGAARTLIGSRSSSLL